MRLLFVLFLGIIPGFWSCGSAPAAKRHIELRNGDLAEVSYSQRNQSEMVQTLRWPATAATEAAVGARNFTRSIDQAEMQALLDAFSTLGYFDRNGMSVGGQAKAELCVRINGQSNVWPGVFSVEKQGDFDRFHQCLEVFQMVFNRSRNYQALTNQQVDRIREKGKE